MPEVPVPSQTTTFVGAAIVLNHAPWIESAEAPCSSDATAGQDIPSPKSESPDQPEYQDSDVIELARWIKAGGKLFN
eukprot:3479096-Pyramimonas_sp.AAC.1